jgi:fluoride ion exporter CrcB/FEX
VLVGFIGSYTTFSTWTLESWRLIEVGAYGVALANLDEMIGEGLITLEKVRVIAYRAPADFRTTG